MGAPTPVVADRAANVLINVNKGNVTAQEIANAVNRANKASGTNIIRDTAIRRP
jgi:hypothetical protein